jgi:hypothetical protein
MIARWADIPGHFLGNGSVNMFPQQHTNATIEELCFLCAKARIFNNVLYEFVRYVHLTKASHLRKTQIHPLSEKMLHMDYDRKSSVKE